MMATPSLALLNPRQQSAALILARQAARNAVKRQIQRQGRVKLWCLTARLLASPKHT
jgi:hypothetical protein